MGTSIFHDLGDVSDTKITSATSTFLVAVGVVTGLVAGILGDIMAGIAVGEVAGIAVYLVGV